MYVCMYVGGYETLKQEGLSAAATLIGQCYQQGLGVIVVHGMYVWMYVCMYVCMYVR